MVREDVRPWSIGFLRRMTGPAVGPRFTLTSNSRRSRPPGAHDGYRPGRAGASFITTRLKLSSMTSAPHFGQPIGLNVPVECSAARVIRVDLQWGHSRVTLRSLSPSRSRETLSRNRDTGDSPFDVRSLPARP